MNAFSSAASSPRQPELPANAISGGPWPVHVTLGVRFGQTGNTPKAITLNGIPVQKISMRTSNTPVPLTNSEDAGLSRQVLASAGNAVLAQSAQQSKLLRSLPAIQHRTYPSVSYLLVIVQDVSW